MTMHLMHPSYSLNGKRKGKRKFRNADAARKSRELKESWEDLKTRWDVKAPNTKSKDRRSPAPTVVLPTTPEVYRRDTGPRIPSLNNGVDTGIAARPADKVYTGTAIIGIGTMHKSNAVPIFSSDDAKAISSMRR